VVPVSVVTYVVPVSVAGCWGVEWGVQHLSWLTQDCCVVWVLVGAWGAAGIGIVLKVSMNSGFVSVVDCSGMRLLL
jgi:hypothetical protein